MRPDPGREFQRWIKQAEADLSDALYSLQGKRYNLTCFLAQQAAEKALKGFLYLQGHEIVWGHSVAELLDDASASNPQFLAFKDKGASLDRLYIPTRYPNGLPGGIPAESFTEKDAREALEMAREIIDFSSSSG